MDQQGPSSHQSSGRGSGHRGPGDGTVLRTNFRTTVLPTAGGGTLALPPGHDGMRDWVQRQAAGHGQVGVAATEQQRQYVRGNLAKGVPNRERSRPNTYTEQKITESHRTNCPSSR